MSIERTPTIIEFVKECAQKFEDAKIFLGHGTDNYWDEAVYLTISVLDLPPDLTEEEAAVKVSAEQLEELHLIMNERIMSRKPLPYLTGVCWYRNCKFFVNENTIIPRSPIAELIENDFFGFVDPEQEIKILDLCTGSGALAILSALYAPYSLVDAIDISSEALKVAKENIKYYDLEDRVRLLESDLFEECTNEYDIIISNPPYVGVKEYDSLPKEYKHEPRIALVSDNNGFEIPLKIIKNSKRFLKDGGSLILEVGYGREEFNSLIEETKGKWLDFSAGGDGVIHFDKGDLR